MVKEMDNGTNRTEIAVLLDTVNKYEPGSPYFRLLSISGLGSDSESTTTTKFDGSNLLNADTSVVACGSATTSDAISIDLPKEITKTFTYKWIPPGTRFIVGFTSGDITKPIIVGREW